MISRLEKALLAHQKGLPKRALRLLSGRFPHTISPGLLAEVHELRGKSFQSLGRFERARPQYQKARLLYHRAKDPFSAGRLLMRLGDIERQMERFKSAYRFYDQAQKILGKSNLKDVSLVRDAAVGKALCVRGQGDFASAERWFRDLVRVYRRSGDKEGEAYSYWALGTTQRFLGRLASAAANLIRSVGLYRRLKNPDGLAYARCGLGGVYRMKGWARESGELYKSAYETFKKIDDEFGQAYSFCGQANAARMQNDYRRSRRLFHKAADLYKRLRQKGPLGFVLWSLAQQDISQNRPRSASRRLNESARLFESVQDRRGRLYVELGRGAYTARFNPHRQTRHWRTAYEMAKRTGLYLESVHALRSFSTYDIPLLYRRAGVDWPRFRRYRGLP